LKPQAKGKCLRTNASAVWQFRRFAAQSNNEAARREDAGAVGLAGEPTAGGRACCWTGTSWIGDPTLVDIVISMPEAVGVLDQRRFEGNHTGGVALIRVHPSAKSTKPERTCSIARRRSFDKVTQRSAALS
jgi:hypothetical protein